MDRYTEALTRRVSELNDALRKRDEQISRLEDELRRRKSLERAGRFYLGIQAAIMKSAVLQDAWDDFLVAARLSQADLGNPPTIEQVVKQFQDGV